MIGGALCFLALAVNVAFILYATHLCRHMFDQLRPGRGFEVKCDPRTWLAVCITIERYTVLIFGGTPTAFYCIRTCGRMERA